MVPEEALLSAVGGTLPFAMVLNQCQKAGRTWGHSAAPLVSNHMDLLVCLLCPSWEMRPVL